MEESNFILIPGYQAAFLAPLYYQIYLLDTSREYILDYGSEGKKGGGRRESI